MEALLATAAAYLAVGWDTARNVDAQGYGPDRASQTRLALVVLITGLLWPYEYWRILKRDWNNHFIE